MAFFCTKTGVRIIAPGVSKAAGGDVDAYEQASEPSEAAEAAARTKLVELAKTDNEAQPSPEALSAAKSAAEEELTKPRPAKAGNK